MTIRRHRDKNYSPICIEWKVVEKKRKIHKTHWEKYDKKKYLSTLFIYFFSLVMIKSSVILQNVSVCVSFSFYEYSSLFIFSVFFFFFFFLLYFISIFFAFFDMPVFLLLFSFSEKCFGQTFYDIFILFLDVDDDGDENDDNNIYH